MTASTLIQELVTEREAHRLTRERLKNTEAERDGRGEEIVRGRRAYLAVCAKCDALKAELKGWTDTSEERRLHLEMLTAERRAFWEQAEKAKDALREKEEQVKAMEGVVAAAREWDATFSDAHWDALGHHSELCVPQFRAAYKIHKALTAKPLEKP